MLYLVVIGLFWLVVIEGGMIAYYFWDQAGKELSASGESKGWLDGVGVASVLFFVWSSDQFYSAFTYREAEENPGDEQYQSGVGSQGQGIRNSGGLWGLVIGTVVYGLIGCWTWIAPARFNAVVELGGVEQASRNSESYPEQVGDWLLKEVQGGSFEGFLPVFAQVDHFNQREWELTRTGGVQEATGIGEAYIVRFRMDGAWYEKPWSGWLWRWYGWRIAEEGSEGELQYWSMSRTIAEEGFVVTGWSRPTAEGACGQSSLEVRGVRPISKEMQREMIGLYEAIQGSFDSVNQKGVPK
jgi:hypothetical protein